MLKLIQNIPIKSKLLLIVIVPFIMMLYFSSVQLAEQLEEKEQAEQLHTSIELVETLSTLIHETQKERGISSMFVASNGTKSFNELLAQRKQTNMKQLLLIILLQQSNFMDDSRYLQESVNNLKNKLLSLKTLRQKIDFLELTDIELIREYSDINHTILSIIKHLPNTIFHSGLALRITSYLQFVHAKELAGQERAIVTAALTIPNPSFARYKDIVDVIAKQKAMMHMFEAIAHREDLNFFYTNNVINSNIQLDDMRDVVLARFKNSELFIDPNMWFAESTRKINNLKLVDDQIRQNIDTQAQLLTNNIMNKLYATIALLVLSLLLSLLVSYKISKLLLSSIQELNSFFKFVAQSNDYSRHIKVPSKDEFGKLFKNFNEMVASLDKTHQELQNEKGFIESIVTSMQDGLIVFDHSEKVVRTNLALQNWVGKSEKELFGASLSDLFTEASTSEGVVDYRVKTANGSTTPVQVVSSKMFDSSKQNSRTRDLGNLSIMVLHDISKVIELNNAKDNFLAAMSHELRTPLTSIIGNSELLIEEEYTKKQQHHLYQSIEIAGRNLLYIVNDILDYSKITAGKFHIHEIEFDLNRLTKELEHIFLVKTEEKGLTFTLSSPKDITYKIVGDDKRIGQVLVNLLGNAVKFTANGKITLDIKFDLSAEKIVYQVTDQGIGMSEKVVKNLFQPFQQADSSTSRNFGGTGLGLYISSELTKLMGETIAVTSKEGEGSCFSLSLPLKKGAQLTPELIDRKKAKTTQTFTGNVLLAEDTPELQILTSAILKQFGIDVTTANNGIEVLAKAKEQHFDLILMDIQMPEMDGLEATKILNTQSQSYKGSTPPIVALTANVMQRHKDEFAAAGGVDFLSKPIDKSELQKVLHKYLT